MFKVLDLCCKAGGAARGLKDAWADAEITGVDLELQPNYPYSFLQADALALSQEYLRSFDFIWCSPHCQGYSVTRTLHAKEYPKQIEDFRKMLAASGVDYVIENVVGAPLDYSINLCGLMFGLKVYRHRLFESNRLLLQPPHLRHPARVIDTGRPVSEGDYMTVCGHFSNVPYARKAMGIDWMNQGELAQAIPPAYSKFIALQVRPVVALDMAKEIA